MQAEKKKLVSPFSVQVTMKVETSWSAVSESSAIGGGLKVIFRKLKTPFYPCYLLAAL